MLLSATIDGFFGRDDDFFLAPPPPSLSLFFSDCWALLLLLLGEANLSLFLSTARFLICSDSVADLGGVDDEIIGAQSPPPDDEDVRLAARAASCSANDIVT